MSRRAGFTLWELLWVIAAMGLLGLLLSAYLRSRADANLCMDRLRQIYTALEMYEMDHGALPDLAFFPPNPRTDAHSLRVALEPYLAVEPICPAAPPSHRELGMTYVWNVANNRRRLGPHDPPSWLLVELTALSDEAPPPHFGAYHVLYTDGRILRSRTAPNELRTALLK